MPTVIAAKRYLPFPHNFSQPVFTRAGNHFTEWTTPQTLDHRCGGPEAAVICARRLRVAVIWACRSATLAIFCCPALCYHIPRSQALFKRIGCLDNV